MEALRPLFAALFPELERPVYEQDSLAELLLAHLGLVAVSSAAAAVVGGGAGIFITRPAGREFRQLADRLFAIGQTVPPVAVLAVATPLIGFGYLPALIALTLYGLLPIMRSTVAGLEAVPAAVLDAGRGQGLDRWQLLWRVELALAAPAMMAGLRTSVSVNIGTAALASTVGARTLGTPIITGLNGFNTAYVLQGAVLLGLLAIVVDLGLARVDRRLTRWQS